MQFSTLLVGFLATFAIASPIADVEARAAAVSKAPSILTNLTNIITDVKTLNTTLNGAPNAGPFTTAQLVNILNQSNKLAADINSTTKNVNSSTAFTEVQSGQLYNKTSINLKPAVVQLLNNFVRHKPAFNSQGLKPTVVQQLQAQRELTRELGNALIAKGAADYKTKSTTLANSILAAFDSAIKSFST